MLLVFGAFLVIVGATASGQAMLVTADASASLLNAAAGADATAVRSFVGLNLTAADLGPGGPTASRRDALDQGLASMVANGGMLHAALLSVDGLILASDLGASAGQLAPLTDGFARAVRERAPDVVITSPAAAGAIASLGNGDVIREYLPVIDGADVAAIVVVWRDAAPILERLDDQRLHVVAITLTAALISAGLLALIFRAAQQRLSRQTVQLLEATKRDSLTDSLNHGSLVDALTRNLDTAKREGGAVDIALVDIDNFGLLNDTYGHQAADGALLELARLLRSHLPDSCTWGRYGPDEFLVVSAHGDGALEQLLTQVRVALADVSLRFESSERLPVTVSASICRYPVNGESVTTLLSVAAITLDQAKASGGDMIRVADAKPPTLAYASTFDVLQGLVFAVDTKDRYTRRHSEDVARYADFLARQLGLDSETRRAIHTAGLLHDVGKIGIPDAILRKPGKLSDHEHEIVKQHVALGDLIVRDLPDIERIRAGVRHHHERWDGRGYLDCLAAEEIPLIARILAVGDAFSAMTTTRPYRKALSVEEALRRLEDAAGSQFDEQLVETFVRGIWTATDAPLPGAPVTLLLAEGAAPAMRPLEVHVA
jgi:diguanylate cyclase (GGDEF)-like protein